MKTNEKDPRAITASGPEAAKPVSMVTAWLVTFLGFGAMTFEGYDLVVYGTAVPSLLAVPGWHLTPARVGAIGGAALLGMFFGAPASGWLADRFGRRRLYIGLLSFFSFMMIFAALAPSPGFLALFRFLAGVGFGGIPPTAIAMVTEFAPPHRKVIFNGLMLTGFGAGGIAAGALSILLLGHMGFRGMFGLGALPLLTLVPLAAFVLPESPNFLRARQHSRAAIGSNRPEHSESPWSGVLKGRALLATALFAVTNFCAFLLAFALLTWLPQIMRGAGFALGSSLQFLLLFNLGATAGALAGAWIADRVGPRPVVTGMFLIASVALALLALPAPSLVLRGLVFIAGATGSGSQTVLFGYMATYYRSESRATAIGAASGVGRLGAATGPVLGGLILTAGIGLKGNVLIFAAAALTAAIAVFLVPRMVHAEAENPTTPDRQQHSLSPAQNLS